MIDYLEVCQILFYPTSLQTKTWDVRNHCAKIIQYFLYHLFSQHEIVCNVAQLSTYAAVKDIHWSPNDTIVQPAVCTWHVLRMLPSLVAAHV